MFEKEAEDNKPPYAFCAFDTKCELWKDGFQKGAEFGYNKAMNEQGYRIESAYSEGVAFGKDKANEWHILAEESDILPKEGQRVKVLTEEGNIESSTYYYDTYYEEFAWSNIGLLKVFAWKEIVLPKESE